MTEQHFYSFYGSNLILPMSARIAENYNRRVQQFIDAQKRFKAESGIEWTPEKLLWMENDPEATAAYNLVGELIDVLVKCCEGGILAAKEELCTEDGLVRID